MENNSQIILWSISLQYPHLITHHNALHFTPISQLSLLIENHNTVRFTSVSLNHKHRRTLHSHETHHHNQTHIYIVLEIQQTDYKLKHASKSCVVAGPFTFRLLENYISSVSESVYSF